MRSAHFLDNGLQQECVLRRFDDPMYTYAVVQSRSRTVSRLTQPQLARSVAKEIATVKLVLQAKSAAVHITYVAYA